MEDIHEVEHDLSKGVIFNDLAWAPAGILARRGEVYLLPFLSIPSPVSSFFSSPFHPAMSTLLFFLCYEADPINTAKVLQERCKLPSGVRGRAPAAITT